MATVLVLAACNDADRSMVGSRIETRVAARVTPTALPSAAPVPAPSPDSAEAAAAVVRDHYALIAARNYAGARRLWEPAASGAPDAFARDFARYAVYRATVGAPGRIDAGAGQRYVEVPVTVAARRVDGGDVALAGSVILHRAADIDGATPAQRRWRIRSADLRPAR